MSVTDKEIIDGVRALAAAEEVRAAREVELPADFIEQVLARIREEDRGGGTIPPNRRILHFPRLGFALTAVAALLVVSGLFFLPDLYRPSETFAMFLPPPKGGPPPDAGRLVETSVKVSVNWKKQTLSIPLKAGGRLTGQFQRAATNVPALPLVYDVSVTAVGATQSLTGTGQWVVMPRDPDGDHGRLSAKTILWTKLNLKLQAGAEEELLYRVFGTP